MKRTLLALSLALAGCSANQAMVADSASTYAGLAGGLAEANPVMNPVTMPFIKAGLKNLYLRESPEECMRGMTGFTGLQTAVAGWNIGLLLAGGPLGAVLMSLAVGITNQYWEGSAIEECFAGLTESLVEVEASDPRPALLGTEIVRGKKIIRVLTPEGEAVAGEVLAQQPAVSSESIIPINAARIVPYIPSPRWVGSEWREVTPEDVASGKQEIIKANGRRWQS